jgi:hypothetical protein
MIRRSSFHDMRLLIAIIFITNLSLAQGPVDGYLKGKGNLDLALSGFYQHSEKFYSGLGLINYQRTLSGATLFGEYGITESADAIVSIPFINGAFQDAAIFIKYRLFRKQLGDGFPLTIMPAFGASFPISNYPTQTGQSIGQRAVQIQPKLVLQFNTKPGIFIQAQSGYNYTLDPVPSSIPFSAKIGYAGKKLYSDFWFDYQKGLGDIIWSGGASIDFRTLHVSYSKIGGVIYYGIKPKIGIFVNGSYILSGINIGKAYSVGAGLVYKFDLIK